MSFAEKFPHSYNPYGSHVGEDEDLELPFDGSTPTVSVDLPEPLAQLVNAASEFYAVEPERVVYEAVAERLKTSAELVMGGKSVGALLDFLIDHGRQSADFPAKAPERPWGKAV